MFFLDYKVKSTFFDIVQYNKFVLLLLPELHIFDK